MSTTQIEPTLPKANTPLLRQYLDVKKDYAKYLLLFRMGDFYELFYEDAKRASQLLGLTLTKRHSTSDDVPMAGVPAQSLEQYIARLVRLGETVVICDQVGEDKGKGLIERKVTQIITPGTLTDLSLLPTRQQNIALAIAFKSKLKNQVGYAYLDLAKGEMTVGQCLHQELNSIIERLQPAEIILPDSADVPAVTSSAITQLDDLSFNPERGHQTILDFLQTKTLASFGLEDVPVGLGAAGALLEYTTKALCAQPVNIWHIGPERKEHNVYLDLAARRSLEIDKSLFPDGPTLYSTLDKCVTAAGGRLLRNRLHNPVRDKSKLVKRQRLIKCVLNNASEVLTWLNGKCDLERLVSRIVLGSIRPAELAAIRDLLKGLPSLHELLTTNNETKNDTDAFALDLTSSKEILAILENQLAQNPAPNIIDGGVIAQGFNTELDELLQLANRADVKLEKIEQREREQTKINNLRIKYNRMLGYYVEVPRLHSSKVPAHYQRRQTIKHAERYLLEELTQLEVELTTAKANAIELEKKLYKELIKQIQPYQIQLRLLADTLATLDLSCTLAQFVTNKSWIFPTYLDEPEIIIKQGKHPVVEATVKHFVANDTKLSFDNRLHVVTGPNMGGKSTYMRQVGLLSLLALAGMPVPAEAMQIGPIDAIMTRVGAADDLAGGRSTFMVEMTETASILNLASKHSLVLLDEIGRGTSTQDGLALAWAVAQGLIEKNQSLVILATHYLELSKLTEVSPVVNNYQLLVSKSDDQVVMLHRVEPGIGTSSYGFVVAKLAGIPAHVIQKAQTYLMHNADVSIDIQSVQSLPFDFAETKNSEIEKRIQELDIDSLSPKQALDVLYELKLLKPHKD